MDPSEICIHTLNARGNVMLEVVQAHSKLTREKMKAEIWNLVRDTSRALDMKGLKYQDLKRALVPQPDRRELALIFLPSATQSAWYGLPIQRQILPLLHRQSSRSILAGDIGGNVDLYTLSAVLTNIARPARKGAIRLQEDPYVVYINNLTEGMIEDLHASLVKFDAYLGCVDTTYRSSFKTYLSGLLVNIYLQHKNFIVCPQEDDSQETEDVNLSGYEFEEYGFTIRSIPDLLWGTLLTYKIEREVLPGFGTDTDLALNAIHAAPMQLEEMTIVVDARKFDYLMSNKSASLRGIGSFGKDAVLLKELIKSKISSNYIYNLTYQAQHDIAKFNVIIEVNKFRVVVALEYRPRAAELRLITMF